MALGMEETFPIANVTDDVIGYEVGENTCEILVCSPGPDGFVVVVMSNYS